MRWFLFHCFLLPLLASFAPATEPEVEAEAERIDALVAAALEADEKDPAPILDDHAFARRTHLAIIGRIPTAAELAVFLEDPDRTRLIEELHEHPGRLSHDYNWWADLLRVKDKVAGVPETSTRAYANWLRKAIADNRPYDEMVRELVAAQGYAGDNGAVGFYQRDRGMPLDHLANTAQTFLGTRLVCAQCHDHPFEEWTQMDYYKLVAFSGPMKVGNFQQAIGERLPQIRDLMTPRERTIRTQSFSAVSRPFRNTFLEETTEPVKLPHDYQYEDGTPGDEVLPQTPFGDLVEWQPGESRIAAYAEWMTGNTNPRFTRVIANRLWKRTMGIGLIEPVDDLDGGTAVGDPALLDALEELVRTLDHDLVAFRKILFHTDLFQRRAVPYDLGSGERFAFPGPRHQRLLAEQIWDTIGVLIRDDLDESIRLTQENPRDTIERHAWQGFQKQQEDLEGLLDRTRAVTSHLDKAAEQTNLFRERLDQLVAARDLEGAAGWLDDLIETTDRDLTRYTELTWLGEGPEPARILITPYLSIRQQVVQTALPHFPQLKQRYVAYFFQHHSNHQANQAKKARQAAIEAEYQKLRSEKDSKAADAWRRVEVSRMKASGITRASELGNPSPEIHFLRELGQSDRELINNYSRDATIPQLLEFRNGYLSTTLLNTESSLWINLRDLESDEKVIQSLFTQMLTREPHPGEMAMLLPEFAEGKESGIRSTVLVLLNTAEFVFPP